MATPTRQQQRAIEATGDVLVVAGAGAGKTSTLVRRILSRVLSETNPVSLDQFLVVTFTDAAAAEMRHRLRLGLEAHLAAHSSDSRAMEQLAILELAQVSTLHSLCLRLVREHFHALGLDPQFAIQDALQNRILGREALHRVLSRHYALTSEGEPGGVRRFLSRFASDQDGAVRDLILRLHDFARTLPDPAAWLEWQRSAYESPTPGVWEAWLAGGAKEWAMGWLDHADKVVAGDAENAVAPRVANDLRQLSAVDDGATRAAVAAMVHSLVQAGAKENFPHGTMTRWRGPLKELFDEAGELDEYLALPSPGGVDPLLEDWNMCRGDMVALLQLVEEFTAEFAAARAVEAVVDFADLEQYAIRLLWDASARGPTLLARRLQQQFEFVFVDEYQDINGAQDRILACLSRGGAAANRFFVGDVKQSIYRFRRADPRIFQGYSRDWRQGEHRGVVALTENFRSHERILGFVNELFSTLMRSTVGGVAYDEEARLVFGAPTDRVALRENPEGRVELLLHVSGSEATISPAEDESVDADAADDLDVEEAQAAMVAARLREMRESGMTVLDGGSGKPRPVEWQDMVVLHPAPRPVAERWARRFMAARVPLDVRRGGFFEAMEVSDLVHLIRLLDNPHQDQPLLAVLRSPLVGLSLVELAAVRLAGPKVDLWEALGRTAAGQGEPASQDGSDPTPNLELQQKATWFLESFGRWRRLARERSLARCLETMLAETSYESWLRAQPRADVRLANVRKLLKMAREFDQFQRHGVFRFLQYLDAQQSVDQEVESAPAAGAVGVRMLSIHQSKGLEFPVVVVAGLGRSFNQSDLRGEWLVEGHYGVCPPVLNDSMDRRYPSLPRWLAGDRMRREFAGEQIRLLYVACTRASERLLLAGTASSKELNRWLERGDGESTREATKARHPLAWLGPRITSLTGNRSWSQVSAGSGAWMDWRLIQGSIGHIHPDSDEDIPAVIPPDAETLELLRRRLQWEYAFTAALHEPAKVAVTTLGRRWREDEEAAAWSADSAESPGLAARSGRHEGSTRTVEDATSEVDTAPRRLARHPNSADAVERGIAHHLVCELTDLAALDSRASLEAQIEGMLARGWILESQFKSLDLEGLWAWWDSELGRRIRQVPDRVHRELPFTLKLDGVVREHLGEGWAECRPGSPASPSEPGRCDDFQVVQGVVDVAVIHDEEIWIIDYKTDHAEGSEVETKAEAYRIQLRLYAQALALIYRRPVTESWLYFLGARRAVRMV
ncbi:MAG: UvrD-helicase domain-containing protein [Verrucomicrobiales bacterium]|nr:UvrD-helicase domain-containing protein [Verrucomicrobiales bacterium]